MVFNTFDNILQFFFDVCKNTNQRISCAIWLKSKENIMFIKNKIENLINTIPNLKIYRNNGLPVCINFENGSKIDILIAIPQKGRRYTLSAFDINIDDSIVETIITPCSFGGFYPKSFTLQEVK